MAEIAKYRVDGGVGCGFMGGIFRRRSNWPRKTSVHSLPAESSNDEKKALDTDISKRQRSGNYEKPARNSALGHPRPSISHRKVKGQRPSDAARTSTSPSPTSGPDSGDERKPKTEHAAKSTELSKTTADPLKSSEGKALVRATSSDIMLSGHLGNLRQTGPRKSLESASPHSSAKTLDYLSKSLQRKSSVHSRNANMGNIIRKNSDESRQLQGLGNQLDPEVFKSLGNEAFKQGRYQEALTLYDRAIALDSKKSTYHSNKSAALIGLGRLMEAIFECKEAIRIEPSYQRAHHRLAKLYIRMGDAENANYHLKRSGAYADSEDMAQAQALQKHLGGCNEGRKLKEWNTLLKDTHRAISSGADSAPQVYALQAEALLNLYRHEEAYATYQKGPNFSNDFCTKLLGRAGSAYLAMIEARVLLAAGRFEDAVAASQRAARLDPSNKEVNAVVKKTKAVSSARLRGNMLFKASKFSEACVMYNEGLENDPYNSVLLCNRAACRSKLGQFEKAVEDCTATLNLRPSYSKARLRRADCNSKLERWEASVQDYEMLIRLTPGDEEVGRALFDAQVQLKRQRGEDTKDLKFGSNLIFITSNERFRHVVTSPGMAVVLFCEKTNNKHDLQVLEQVCKRFPSINFLKVEIEDHPYLAKSERLSSTPAFKIYKNGAPVKEIPSNSREMLESSVKLYSS